MPFSENTAHDFDWDDLVLDAGLERLLDRRGVLVTGRIEADELQAVGELADARREIVDLLGLVHVVGVVGNRDQRVGGRAWRRAASDTARTPSDRGTARLSSSGSVAALGEEAHLAVLAVPDLVDGSFRLAVLLWVGFVDPPSDFFSAWSSSTSSWRSLILNRLSSSSLRNSLRGPPTSPRPRCGPANAENISSARSRPARARP